MILATAAICVVQMVVWYRQLPDVVPSHFNAAGQVDGEMGKTGFYALFVSMHLLFLVGFPLLALGLKKIPDSMINIPNKEYWLAPERREKSLSFNNTLLIAVGWMTSWLFIGIFQLSANVGIGQRDIINPEFYWLLGIYLLAIASVTIWVIMKFRLPASEKLGLSQNL